MTSHAIEGYKNEVEFDGTTLRARGTGKMAHFALVGPGKKDDLVLTLEQIQGVDLTKPSIAANGTVTVKDGSSEYQLHFKKQQSPQFEWLYEQLTGVHAGNAPTVRERRTGDAEFEGIRIKGDRLTKGIGNSWPIADCEAVVDQGVAIQPRITATRVVLTGPFALLLKKDRSKVFLMITCGDEVAVMEPVPGKREAKAREFALKVNAAAKRRDTTASVKTTPSSDPAPSKPTQSPTSTPPAPPQVPAGWYPAGEVQRYWDGTQWTEHTAPLPPST